ncbi:MAG: biosynthetic-type acetolactate synthase large subunit [Clostridiales bacterium]|jgi:acetolactate synthase-1/2/3 large subunit|nr:biosynthetic-type acetolactate synthase large subunit [Clostridiales bacterium]
MKLNGSEILLECLLEHGVTAVFGYPGGTVLNIYDALYKYKDKLRHYLTAHEQGAAHAADGYARATGEVGVCIATSGPGATNLVTGIATAYMDSSPIVAITGNVAKSFLGKDSFQEIDIAGVTMPITKHNFIVRDINDLADVIRKAFYIAREGRPGPVLVDITKDVTADFAEYEPKKPVVPAARLWFDEEDVNNALELIRASEKPFIVAGGGLISSGASKEFAEFVERADAPVAITTMGLGGFSPDHPRFTGMIGMHGMRASNIAAMNCDLLIALGMRFSDRVTGNAAYFAEKAKILHIDADPAEINKNVKTFASVTGDMREVLRVFNGKLERLSHKAWNEEVTGLKAASPLRYKDDDGVLRPQSVIVKINEMIDDDVIVTTDVGQHQMFACQYIRRNAPRGFIMSGGLGTMGFGLGAAIGASVGQPGRTVVNITGDGCFRMNNIELATAATYKLPVITVVMNNHVLGMVRQWQKFFYGRRYSHTTFGAAGQTTDFVKLAQAYNAQAYNVTEAGEFEPAFKDALEKAKNGKPSVINVEIGMDDDVFPMAPSGKRIDEFVDEE